MSRRHRATQRIQLVFERALDEKNPDEALRLIKNNPSINPTQSLLRSSEYIPIVVAMINGYHELFLFMLDSPYTNIGNLYKGFTYRGIGIAIQKNYIEIIKGLIAHVHEVPHYFGWYCIGVASRYGRVDILRMLLESPIESCRDNDSLVLAAQYNHTRAVELLFKHSFGIQPDKYKLAIEHASSLSNCIMLRLLLKRGCDIYSNMKQLYNYAIEIAAKSNCYDALEMLLKINLPKCVLSMRTYKAAIRHTMMRNYVVSFEQLLNHNSAYRSPDASKYKFMNQQAVYTSTPYVFVKIISKWYERRCNQKLLADVAIGLRALALPVLVQLMIVDELRTDVPNRNYTTDWNIMKLVHLTPTGIS